MTSAVAIATSDLGELRSRAVLTFTREGVVLGHDGQNLPHDRRIEVLAPHHPDQLPWAEFTVRMQAVQLLIVSPFGVGRPFCCFRIVGAGAMGNHFAYCCQCGFTMKFTPEVLPNGERAFAPKGRDFCGECDAPVSDACDRCWHTWGRCFCCPPEIKP